MGHDRRRAPAVHHGVRDDMLVGRNESGVQNIVRRLAAATDDDLSGRG